MFADGKKKRQTIFLCLALLLVTATVLSAETQIDPNDYVPNEIIVKFRQPAADSLYLQFRQGAAADGLQFSDSLQKLNNKYKLKKASALFKNFRTF